MDEDMDEQEEGREMSESITKELRDCIFDCPHLKGVADRIDARFDRELTAKHDEVDGLMSDNSDLQARLDGKIVVNGDTSDGYHTFSELYDHRAKLLSVVVSDHRDRCWKSMRHHDGSMYDGMFIVGIDTPDGQASYHYDVDPYWGMFDCKELDRAPEWDGHTPEQAIDRIARLASSSSVIRCRDCRFFEPEFVYEERHDEVHCSEFLHEPPGCGRFKTSGVVPNGFCAWAEPKEES